MTGQPGPTPVQNRRIGKRARKGAVWTAAEEAVVWGSSFFVRVLLARILVPHDFGLIAIITLVQQAIKLVATRGISAALIQRKDQTGEYANAAFWLTLGLGWTLGTIQFLVAPFLGRFYHEPLVSTLIRVYALTFFITPLGATHNTLLGKRLQFKRRALRRMTLNLVILSAMVVMALAGWGVWSFVIAHILVEPAEVILNWRLCRWRPRLEFSLRHAREIMQYGKHILVSDALRYLIEHTDYIVVGRVLGAHRLGLYSFAFRQSQFALHHVTTVSAETTFPSFALLQSDGHVLRRAFTKALLLISAVTLPLQLGQFVLAQEYIEAIYGRNWLPAVVTFRVLLIYGISVAISGVARQLLNAINRPDAIWKYHAVVWPLLAGSVLLGVRHGQEGVAVAVGGILGVSSWVFVLYAMRLVRWAPRELLAPLGAPFASAAVMSLGIAGLRWLLISRGANTWVVLLVCIAAGAVLYPLALRALFPRVWTQISGFLGRSVDDLKKNTGETVKRLRRRLSYGPAV